MTWAEMWRAGAEHGQAGPGRGARDVLAHPGVAPDAQRALALAAVGHGYLAALPALRMHAFAGVADPLALVGLGLAELSDVGSHLADLLLVDALHDDAGGRGDLEGDALGGVHRHRVGEAQGELERRRAPGDGPVAHAHDLELLGEPGGDPGHHVGDQRAGEPVQGAVLALVVGALDRQGRRPPGGR